MVGERRHEGEEYPPGTEVWRRIPPLHFPKPPRERPNSSAFDDDSDGDPMSVVVVREGRDPQEVLVEHEGFALVSLSLENLAECDQRLVADPQPDEPDHAIVVGHKTDGTRRKMAKASRWVVSPPNQ